MTADWTDEIPEPWLWDGSADDEEAW